MGFDIIPFLAAAIQAGTPLLFATLGELLIEKSGNLNLGVEGMMLMGAVVGFQVGLVTSNPVLAMLGAMIAGALGAFIFAFLTVKGLNLRMVGESPSAADAAGINVTLYKYVHNMIGGALCGLGGAYLSLVYVPAWQENVTAGRGWIAVALVIFSTWNPYRAILGSFAFGGLDILGFYWHKLDAKIISALPYVATVIVLIFISMKKSKENAPPQGLGEPYFREDR